MCVASVAISALIDTGSLDLSIISESFYDILCGVCPELQLSPPDCQAASVSGANLTVLGRVRLPLKLGSQVVEHEFHVIRESLYPCILGVDCLQSIGAVIDFSKKLLLVNEQKLPFLSERPKFGGFKPVSVNLVETVELPPHSRNRLQASVSDISGFGCGLFEPVEHLCDSKSPKHAVSLVFAARALVSPHNNTVPVEIVNAGHSPVQLCKGTKLGTFEVDVQVSECESSVLATVSSSSSTQPPTLPLGVMLNNTIALTDLQKQEATELIQEYNDIFSKGGSDLGRTHLVEHEIYTEGPPTRQRPYRVPERQRSVVRQAVQDMLEQGVIQPSQSPYAAPIVLVKKKDGTYRFCVDFRRLNAITIKDTYPLPRIDDTLDRLGGSKIFSTMDMNSGYWQVPLAAGAKEKTAFATHEGGLFEFTVLPFGLCNAPATYQRLMELVLAGLTWESCLVYIDDVIVFSQTFAEHLVHLRQVFDRFRQANLKLKGKKCSFFCPQVKYLGHVISAEGVAPDPTKIQAMKDYAQPTNLKMVRSFLGMVQYYARFLPDLATIATPLYHLTKKDVRFKWTPECQEAFDKIKSLLISDKFLSLPNFDHPFILYTDASNMGVGVVLSQIVDGHEKTIAYASHKFTSAQSRYPTIERETLAIVWGIQHFRPYLFGRHFKVITDHNPLKWLFSLKDPNDRMVSWQEKLRAYDFDVEHRSGVLHGNADGLSRSFPEPTPVATVSLQLNSLDLSNFAPAQQADDYCSRIIKVLQGDSSVQMPAFTYVSQFLLKDGLLYRRTCRGKRPRLVIPVSLQNDVLKEAHDSPVAGHLGFSKTLGRISSKYFWAKMSTDVKFWVQSCFTCQVHKAQPAPGRAPLNPIPVTGPFDMMGVDIVGPLPMTQRKNRYLVVFMDYFSKWPEVFPVRSAEAEVVAKLFVEEIISRHSCINTLLSDQGTNFTSRLMKEVCRLMSCKKVQTTTYRPQTDGLVERFNRTLIQCLTAYVDENPKSWDRWIPYVLSAYRWSIHESSGHTPFELVYLREPRQPLDTRLAKAEQKYTDPNDYRTQLLQGMHKVRQLALQNIERAQQKQKQQYDFHSRQRHFKVGAQVLVKIRPKQEKFQPKYKGPFVVVQQTSPVNYVLQLEQCQCTHKHCKHFSTEHVDNLKPFYARV